MKLFRAGELVNQGYYRSFQPAFINRSWALEDMEVINLLSQADRQLGRLDMYSEYVPNLDLFISMHMVKEATQSSRIEGTRTNMEEAFLDREEVSSERRDDWEEVQNYLHAMGQAIQMLEKLPFSSRLVREAHRLLMQGVRGEHKQPGEFRESQNWIGGATISDAVFVPPVHTSIPELMSDLEGFAHNEAIHLPHLIKVALIHYQFETIHPFLDGNGRTGRLMITLYLVSKGVLKQPILYLSDFLERNRGLYYDNLMRVRTHSDISQWLKFFLVGVIETAKVGVTTLDGVLRLDKVVDAKIQAMGARASNARKVVNALYQRPVTDAEKVAGLTGLSLASAYKLIAVLEGAGILKEVSGARRGRIYLFKDYLELFRS